MEKSLCAHCIHCCEVKYGGFMCDNGGYLENKSVNDGCKYFENDVDKFNDNIKKAKESVITKKKWLKLYDYIDVKINECVNVFRDRYNGVDISPYEHVENESRKVYFSIQSIMIELTSYPTTYQHAWSSLATKLTELGKSDNDTKNHVIDSVLSKMKEIERMEDD